MFPRRRKSKDKKYWFTGSSPSDLIKNQGLLPVL